MDEQQKRISWKLRPETEDMLMTVFSTEAGRDDAVLLALRDLEDYYNAGIRNETLPEIMKQLYDYEMKWVEVICHPTMNRFTHAITFWLHLDDDFEYIKDEEVH